MGISEERHAAAEELCQALVARKAMVQQLNSEGLSNEEIAGRLGITENEVRASLKFFSEADWRRNCLFPGVYTGRIEPLWILPLFQAAYMYGKEELEELVIARIYNDAMQLVEDRNQFGDTERTVWVQVRNGERTIFDQEWAEKVRDNARKHYMTMLRHTVGKISHYYQSPEWKEEQLRVVETVQKGTYGQYFGPHHEHDSINMLCRILGTRAARSVS